MCYRLVIKEPNGGWQMQSEKHNHEQDATAHGEKMCMDGNVAEFQVWKIISHKRRRWTLEDVT